MDEQLTILQHLLDTQQVVPLRKPSESAFIGWDLGVVLAHEPTCLVHGNMYELAWKTQCGQAQVTNYETIEAMLADGWQVD